MRLTDHAFTESTPCRAMDIDYDALMADEVRLADIDFDALVAGWNGPEVQAARAEQSAFFDATMGAKRDLDKSREWGCTVAELPWNARKAGPGSLGRRA